jgi:hypothetical protein
MGKYVMLILVVILAAMLGACGSSSSSSDITNGATVVKFSASEISGKTFYQLTPTGYRSYTFNADNSASWSSTGVTSGTPSQDVTGGTWSITSTGALQFVGGSSTYTITRIQTESNDAYWLVYDQANSISRFYYDQSGALTSAQTYLAAITVSSGLYRMGGSVQGVSGTLTKSTGNVTRFAGAATGAAGQGDGDKNTATFDQPVDITTDGTNYYVLDYTDYTEDDERNSTIRKVDASGNVTTLSITDTSGNAVTFENAQGITISPDANYLYVADTGHHMIRCIKLADNTSWIIAGNSDDNAGFVDSETGSKAYFNNPTGITTDGTNLYVADSDNRTIRKIVISSGAVSTLAGDPDKKVDSDDGVYTDARFYTPVRLTTDGSNLYITDFDNRNVRKLVIATGEVTTLAGSKDREVRKISGDESTEEYYDRTGTAARFYHPHGITTDGSNLYVTDWNDYFLETLVFKHLIRKIVISTGAVTTLAGGEYHPTEEPFTDKTAEGVGTAALFAKPRGIVWNGTLKGLLVTNGSESFTISGATRKNVTSANNTIFSILPP